MSRWLTEDRPGGVQVVPLDDLIVHHPSPSCTCAPRIENHGYTCGCVGVLSIRRVIIHNAMDGRE